MPKAILPEPLRIKIIELFQEGMSSLDVYDLIYKDAIQHVKSENQLSRCLVSLKGKATALSGQTQKEKTSSILPPNIQSFDNSKHLDIINQLSETMLGKDFEKACHPIVTDILLNYEGFTGLVDSNNVKGFHNPPFDFFGLKNGRPFIIEFKGSLENFNSPGETQKRRMQELLAKVDGLNISLLQVKLRKGQYRILHNRDLDLLFDGREVPLGPVISWIEDRIRDSQGDSTWKSKNDTG